MKTGGNRLVLLSSLMAGLAWISADRATAQTFTVLHHFTGVADGSAPYAELVLSGNALYGTTYAGGSWSNGTVFRIETDGTAFTNLHSFAAKIEGTPINSEGWGPYAALVLSGNTLYGATPYGGERYNGTLFKLNTDGSDFTLLHAFTSGLDGGEPYGNLILSGDTLYGTTGEDGSGGWGTVFAINTNGTGLTNPHSFTSAPNDGDGPDAGVILSGNTLYGTTIFGGSANFGNVYRVNIDGSGFTNLYRFNRTSDGANPRAALLVSGYTLYGTTSAGGISNLGTAFSLTLPSPPRLSVLRSGTNVVLTWPTNATGFTLQSVTNLVSGATWTTASPGPVVVSGQYTVTNPISGTRKFYRLRQ
jgi:uncharacterized repeat protein (TIGR03803 family)